MYYKCVRRLPAKTAADQLHQALAAGVNAGCFMVFVVCISPLIMGIGVCCVCDWSLFATSGLGLSGAELARNFRLRKRLGHAHLIKTTAIFLASIG